MNLYEAEKNKKYIIVKVDAGYKASHRLNELVFLKMQL